MAVSQARLSRYRADLDDLAEAARSFMAEFIRATAANNPGMSVAELRTEAIGAVDSALYAFGDQASSLALGLFEEIVVDGHGLDAETVIEDAIDPEMIEGGVRYSARQLVEGDTEAFARDVADLTRYYIKRSAMENMVRNCERNDLRYARVPSGRETCAFCFMLSSRGFVYKNEKVAGSAHAYHENCDCVIVPGFEGLSAWEQVEGYDPDGMRERWYDCESAIDWDGAKERWKSMDAKQRGRYKGDSDRERYASFVNAQIRREVETRDWRWLYTGEVPHYSAESGAHPDEYERECGRILRENGFPVHFRKTMGSQKGGYKQRTSDTFIKGDPWEMKNPAGNTDKTVKNQMKKAVGKEAGSAQSDRLIISNVRSDRSVEQMVIDVKNLFEDGRFVEIKEVLIVGRDGSIVRVKR